MSVNETEGRSSILQKKITLVFRLYYMDQSSWYGYFLYYLNYLRKLIATDQLYIYKLKDK